MRLQALLFVTLTASSGVRILGGRLPGSKPEDRTELVQGYEARVENSRRAWRQNPRSWDAAFHHARYLCKLREQQELQLSHGGTARPERPDDGLSGELQEALEDALALARTPQEHRLGVIVHLRAFGSVPPGGELPSHSSRASTGPADW